MEKFIIQDINYSQVKLSTDKIQDINERCEALRRQVIEMQVLVKLAHSKRSFRAYKYRKAKSKPLEFYEQYKLDKDFYNTDEWREVRFHYLTKPENMRCCLCGSEKELHVDHIVPRSIRPDLAFKERNLQTLCKDCNLGKGTNFFNGAAVKIKRKGILIKS